MKQKPVKNNPFIIGVSTEGLSPHTQLQTLPPQAFFILRHYEDPARFALAHELAALAHTQKIFFMIGADKNLAWSLGNLCAGVHYPAHLTRRAQHFRQTATRPHWFISAAAHNQAELVLAALAGADFALLSPLFAPHSKPLPPHATALGVARFAHLAHHSPLPVVALGGCNQSKARAIQNTQALGWAGTSPCRND